MKKTYFQSGYGSVEAFLFAMAIGALIYFFVYPAQFIDIKPKVDITDCVFPQPSRKETIQVGGVTYGLIKRQANIINKEREAHFQKIGTVTVRGEEEDVYRVSEDTVAPGSPPLIKAPNYTQDAEFLRFVDVTDTIPHIQRGLSAYSVYLQQDKSVPEFILQYCAAQKPYVSLVVWQDTLKGSFPPISFNTDQLENIQPGAQCGKGDPLEDLCKNFPPNTTYNLFSYRQKDYFLGAGTSLITTGPCLAYYPSYFRDWQGKCNIYYHADLPVSYLGKTRNYRAENFLNYAEEILLFDTDPTSPYYGYQFEYTPEKYISVLDLATNVNAFWNKQTLQLQAFVPFQLPAWGWWTPECKPAVYLYPEKEQQVTVKVHITNGVLTYTDPVYPKEGWSVLAKPSGELRYLSNNLADSRGKVNYATGIFPYLYYEGKVEDSAVRRPEQGFVKTYEQLPAFFDDILPKLGLNSKESKEFKNYWLKALQRSSYYFIGVLPQAQLNEQEPLSITPKEDTMIRVRLYFEALDDPKSVQEPEIITPKRDGFTVVDWGGMVKQDANHPFTCLQ